MKIHNEISKSPTHGTLHSCIIRYNKNNDILVNVIYNSNILSTKDSFGTYIKNKWSVFTKRLGHWSIMKYFIFVWCLVDILACFSCQLIKTSVFMHQSKWILGGGAATALCQGYIWVYRGLWQQQFFPILLWYHSDITNCRNIDLLGGEFDSDSSWQGVDSDRQTISPSELLGSAWGHPQDSLWQVH